MTAIKKSGNIDDNNQEEKKNEQLEIVDAIKSINPTLLDGIPQKKRAEVLKTITSVIHVTRSKSGPLPDPSDLKEYAEIIPNGAERIMKMAEKEQQFRHDINNTIANKELRQSGRGQILGFILALLTIVCGAWLVYLGKDTAGLVSLIAPLVALIGLFIHKKLEEKKS